MHMSGPDDPPPSQARLSDVDRRVRAALDKRAAAEREAEERAAIARSQRGAGAAWRIVLDLIAATVIVGALGWGVDRLAGSSPFAMLIGLLAGFSVGVWLAARRAAAIQLTAGRAARAAANDGNEGSR